MQLLLDCIRLQKERGKIHNTILGGVNTEDIVENKAICLKTLINTLEAVISDCVDNDYPLEAAFAHAHTCAIKNEEPNWEKWLNDYKPKVVMGNEQGIGLLRRLAEGTKP